MVRVEARYLLGKILRRPLFPLALCGILVILLLGERLYVPSLQLPEEGHVRGTIVGDITVKEDRYNAVLEQVKVDGEEISGKIQITVAYGESVPDTGQEISAFARLFPPSAPTNPGETDYRPFNASKGIVYFAYCQAEAAVITGEPQLSIFQRTRRSLIAKIDAIYGEYAPLIQGMLLGDKSEIDDNVLVAFQRTGVFHVLALSGLHVGFVFLLLQFIAKKARLSPWKRCFVIIPVLLAYLALADFPVSMIRATIMVVIGLFATALGRKQDGLSVLSAAALLIMCVNPTDIYRPGFQLSFGSVLGILCLNAPLQKAFRYDKIDNRMGKYIVGSVCVSLAAQMGVLPFLALHYHTIPVFAVLLNIVVIPLVTLCVFSAFPILFLCYILPFLAPLVSAIMQAPVAGLQNLVSFWNKLPLPTLLLASPGNMSILLLLVGLLAASEHMLRSKALRVAAASFCFLAALLIALPLPESGLHIRMLDVGQGDAMVMETEGYTYLFDVGLEGEITPEYLAYRGSHVDAIFISHPHDDHAGALTEILETVPVGKIFLPEGAHEMADAASLQGLDKAVELGVELVSLSSGDRLELPGGLTIEVLWPRRWAGSNDDSLVLTVMYQDFTLLLTGDAGQGMEAAIDWPEADILKVGHHGSKYATTHAMLHQVKPSIGIIGVGYNSYGHPASETLARMEPMRILRTDESGCLHLHIENGILRYSGFLEE